MLKTDAGILYLREEVHKFGLTRHNMTKIITITGAGGRIAYALIPLICEGGIFGQEVGTTAYFKSSIDFLTNLFYFRQPVHLRLLEVPAAMQRLEGVRLEMEDCTFPLLRKCEITSDVEEVRH